jgi:hypothetical protein
MVETSSAPSACSLVSALPAFTIGLGGYRLKSRLGRVLHGTSETLNQGDYPKYQEDCNENCQTSFDQPIRWNMFLMVHADASFA